MIRWVQEDLLDGFEPLTTFSATDTKGCREPIVSAKSNSFSKLKPSSFVTVCWAPEVARECLMQLCTEIGFFHAEVIAAPSSLTEEILNSVWSATIWLSKTILSIDADIFPSKIGRVGGVGLKSLHLNPLSPCLVYSRR